MVKNSRLVVLVALALVASACGDDPKPKKDTTNTPGDGDGTGDGDSTQDGSAGGDGDQQPGGDGDGGQPGPGDGGSVPMDGGSELPPENPFEGIPDAGPDGSVLTEDQKLELAVNARLRKCGIVSATGNFNQGLVLDDFDRCIGDCVVNAACSHIKGSLCGGVKGTPFAICQDQCNMAPADGFLCSDSTRIPHVATCDDGAYQATCPNHEEDGVAGPNHCPQFTCADGDKVSVLFVCDGVRVSGDVSVGGCKDGSDEAMAQNCATICPK